MRVIFLFSFVLLFGCTVNQLRLDDLAVEIETISINPEVKLPEEIHFKSFNNEKAKIDHSSISSLVAEAVLKVLQKLIEDYAYGSTESILEEYLQRNQINVDQILMNRFISRVKDNPMLVSRISSDKADAVLHLEIEKYGLHQLSRYTTSFRPVLVVRVELVHQSGKTLWIHKETVSHRNRNTTSFKVEQFLSDPNCSSTAWEQSIDIALSGVMKRIN
jgi:hypothetical protein